MTDYICEKWNLLLKFFHFENECTYSAYCCCDNSFKFITNARLMYENEIFHWILSLQEWIQWQSAWYHYDIIFKSLKVCWQQSTIDQQSQALGRNSQRPPGTLERPSLWPSHYHAFPLYAPSWPPPFPNNKQCTINNKYINDRESTMRRQLYWILLWIIQNKIKLPSPYKYGSTFFPALFIIVLTTSLRWHLPTGINWLRLTQDVEKMHGL